VSPSEAICQLGNKIKDLVKAETAVSYPSAERFPIDKFHREERDRPPVSL
jgi:hypothetical protein